MEGPPGRALSPVSPLPGVFRLVCVQKAAYFTTSIDPFIEVGWIVHR